MITPTRAAMLVGYKAGSDAAGRAAVFVVLMLAARRLPLDDFGLLSLATTMGWLGAVASDFGMQLHLSRVMGAAPADAGAAFWPLFRLRLVTASVAIVAVALVSRLIAPDVWIACAALAAAPILTGVSEFVHYGFRALDRTDLESSLQLAQRLSALLLAVLVAAWRPSLLAFGVALLLPAGVALVVARHLAGRLLPPLTPPAGPPLTLAEWRVRVAPIGLGIVLSVVYFRVDVFLLERWTGLDTVAHYSAVFRIVDAIRLLPAAVIAVALPRLLGARDAAFAARLSAGLLVAGGVVAAGTAALAAPIVVAAYGPLYTDALPVFRVLLLSLPLLAMNMALTHQLIGWHQQSAYAWTCAAALVANLSLNTWLIPAMGGLGAAWATLGTELVVTAGCLAGLYRSHTSR